MGLTMKSNNELEKLFNKFAILPDDKDKKKIAKIKIIRNNCYHNLSKKGCSLCWHPFLYTYFKYDKATCNCAN